MPESILSMHDLRSLKQAVEDGPPEGAVLEQIIQEDPSPNLWMSRYQHTARRNAVVQWLESRDDLGSEYQHCAWSQTLLHDHEPYVTLANGDIVSEQAFDAHGASCDHCGDAFHRDDVEYLEGVGRDVCDSCRDEYDQCDVCGLWSYPDEECCRGDHTEEILNSYESPLDYLKGFRRAAGERPQSDRKTLWLGVELEVVPRGRHDASPSDVLQDVEGFAILKADGSLPSDGFEIVTVPGTLAWHREAWRKFFKNSARRLLSYHAPSRCCGMHVHIAKDALTPLQAGKMMVFVADERNSAFLKQLAGRGNGTYTRAFPKRLKDGDQQKGARHGHFDALGYSSNTGSTLEFRIFRGTVNHNGFFKNLEFTVALVEFCKETSATRLLVDDFLNWFKLPENRTRFPELDSFLHRKGYLAIKKPRQDQDEAA